MSEFTVSSQSAPVTSRVLRWSAFGEASAFSSIEGALSCVYAVCH